MDLEQSLLKNESKFEEIRDTIRDKTSNARDEWKIKIEDLLNMSKNFAKLIDVQVLMLSYRHILVDYLYGELYKAHSKVLTSYEKAKKKTLITTKIEYDLKLNTEKERFTIIESDLRIISEIIELFEAQIQYVKETIKTLDNLGYTIKNHIEHKKIISGE